MHPPLTPVSSPCCLFTPPLTPHAPSGVVTKSLDSAIKLANSLRAGTVYVNSYDVFDSNTPFGGYKDSGVGRELGEAGLKNYLEEKTVIIKRPDDSLP